MTGLATEWGGFTQGWAVPHCAQRLVQPSAAADAVTRAAHAWPLSRLRRLNGACDGLWRGGRRRRPNHAIERTSSLRSDVAALAPYSPRRATGTSAARGVPPIARPDKRTARTARLGSAHPLIAAVEGPLTPFPASLALRLSRALEPTALLGRRPLRAHRPAMLAAQQPRSAFVESRQESSINPKEFLVLVNPSAL